MFKTVLCLLVFLPSCISLQDNYSVLENSNSNLSEIDVEVVLVLGAGGSRGTAHIGVIEVLQEANIPIDLIVGCSSGSIVGSLYSDTKNIKKVKKAILSLKRKDILGPSMIASTMGLSDGGALKRFLDKNLNSKDFSKLKIPFWSVATDLENGRLAVFSGGAIVPAVAASAAFPGMFEPVTINSVPFVDGGVLAPVPVEIARRTRAKVIIAVDIAADLPPELPGNLLGVVKRSMEINYLAKSKESQRNADIVIAPHLEDSGTFSDTFNEKNFLAGRKEALKVLPQIKKLLKKKAGKKCGNI